jgi:hypothetical protein
METCYIRLDRANMRAVSCAIAAATTLAMLWLVNGSARADANDHPITKKTAKASKRQAKPDKAAAPAAPSPMTTPAMAGPLAANPHPFSFDAGFLGPVYVTGAISGLGLVQSNHIPTDHEFVPSLTNGQVFVQKTEGSVQYFVQAGAYAFPAVGAPDFNTAKFTSDFYGPVPVAFVKLVPTNSFSVMAGKLPTLIGAEYTFSFENMNIQRGLLWNQENAINRGVRANYTVGPVVFALSWNDGFYSNQYSWLTGSATWTIDSANTLSFVGGGNTAPNTSAVTLATPIQNNQQIFNLIYTYNAAPWIITPYFQATHVPANPSAGAFHDASTFGGAILGSYSFPTHSLLRGVSLPLRLEYISSTGSAANGAPSLIYGPGSSAWSVTLTPTYQFEKYFVRAEVAYVDAMHTMPGAAFGLNGNAKSRVRGALEFGILF